MSNKFLSYQQKKIPKKVGLADRLNLGFTLLEILIALFIFTIVSLIIVSGLRTVLNSQSRTEENAAHFNELQITLLLMTRDFEQAINRPITNAKNITEEGFVGTPRQVTFTHAGLANPLGQLPRSTLQRTQYLVTQEQLARETWPVLDQSAKTLPDQRILLNEVSDIRFEYLDDQNKFQNNWPASQQRPGLPKGIRVTLTLKNWGKITQLFLLPGSALVK